MERINARNPGFNFFLRQLRSILQYQLMCDEDVAQTFFPATSEFQRSKKTGKIRLVYLENKLRCALKPNDGFIKLALDGAVHLLHLLPSPKLRIIVQNDVAPFICQGRNVFAKHVKDADEDLRPGSEVIIVNECDELLGVGTLLLTQKEIRDFKRGVAANTRHGLTMSSAGPVSTE